jgi:peptide deformylase
MSLLKVAHLGHPVLRAPAAKLTPVEVAAPVIQSLIDDMIVTMHEYDGVGLAAVQVHEALQIAVLEVADNPRYPGRPPVPLTVLINPEFTPLVEKMEEDWEGCLSLPDLRGRVPRWTAIRVTALDRWGKPLEFECRGFAARVVQHEWDHLHGKIFIDRMNDFSTLTHLREFVRYWVDRRDT